RDPDFWNEYHHNVQGQIEKINHLLTDLRTAADQNPGDPFGDEIQLQAASRITFTAESQNGEMIIRLTDNGPALPPEALRIVLDPFLVTTGAPSEYGINLMVFFFIAHHQGEKIGAKTLRGAGNVIPVRLPLQPVPA